MKTTSSLVQGIANELNDQSPSESTFWIMVYQGKQRWETKPQPPRLRFNLARYLDSYHRQILDVNQS